MIRVGLADDQELVRAGFAALLDAEDDIEVAGEAADGQQAVHLAERQAPDVLLMDIRMPVLDGIEATRRIAAQPELAGVHVVILTTFELDEYVFEGLRAGAAGFLVKDTDAAELIRAVRVVAGGAALLAPTVTRRLIAEFASRTRHARSLPGLDELTPREREVVVLIALGLSNEEIARKIYISPSTAKTHAARAMTKVGARDRAQLVVFAYQAGLVRPGWDQD
jgi:DNA-binding NarL/FixJ family response regulator